MSHHGGNPHVTTVDERPASHPAERLVWIPGHERKAESSSFRNRAARRIGEVECIRTNIYRGAGQPPAIIDGRGRRQRSSASITAMRAETSGSAWQPIPLSSLPKRLGDGVSRSTPTSPRRANVTVSVDLVSPEPSRSKRDITPPTGEMRRPSRPSSSKAALSLTPEKTPSSRSWIRVELTAQPGSPGGTKSEKGPFGHQSDGSRGADVGIIRSAVHPICAASADLGFGSVSPGECVCYRSIRGSRKWGEGLLPPNQVIAEICGPSRVTSGCREIRRSTSLAANASTHETPTTQTRTTKMGKIVVSQNVSIDSVVEDPTGEDGFRHGGWSRQFIGQDWEAWTKVELAEAQVPRPC